VKPPVLCASLEQLWSASYKNIERPTSNTEHRIQTIQHSVFGVRCSVFPKEKFSIASAIGAEESRETGK
jgi:hypothetical protein